jgi:hypothetical protein
MVSVTKKNHNYKGYFHGNKGHSQEKKMFSHV